MKTELVSYFKGRGRWRDSSVDKEACCQTCSGSLRSSGERKGLTPESCPSTSTLMLLWVHADDHTCTHMYTCIQHKVNTFRDSEFSQYKAIFKVNTTQKRHRLVSSAGCYCRRRTLPGGRPFVLRWKEVWELGKVA